MIILQFTSASGTYEVYIILRKILFFCTCFPEISEIINIIFL